MKEGFSSFFYSCFYHKLSKWCQESCVPSASAAITSTSLQIYGNNHRGSGGTVEKSSCIGPWALATCRTMQCANLQLSS